MSSSEFRKHRTGAHRDFFAAEAAGLRWLADAGAPVAEVLDVGADHITLGRLVSAAPTRIAAREFGAELARMHGSGADRFGCGPAGFTGQMFIGNRPMPSAPTRRWGEFYARQRVLAFVDDAVAAGNLSRSDEADTREVCELIASGTFDDGAPPARLHGDLWNEITDDSDPAIADAVAAGLANQIAHSVDTAFSVTVPATSRFPMACCRLFRNQ